MVGLDFEVLTNEANTLETAIVLFSISSVLQWCFLIIVAITIATYIRKENAHSTKGKHSHKHYRKGR